MSSSGSRIRLAATGRATASGQSWCTSAQAGRHDGHEAELTRGAYQQICGVSRSQAAYDLAELVEAGVLERIGGGRSTRYVLVREPNSSRRHWTSDRIRSELVHFCAGRPAWPSAREFKSAGRTDLYVA